MNLTDRQLFRAVRGAVQDVRNSHPNWIIDPGTAHSITKRLAGTLRSLGAPLAPNERGQDVAACDGPQTRKYPKSARSGPHRILHFLGLEAGKARRDGNHEREQAFIDVLRFVAGQKKNSAAPRRRIGSKSRVK
jgi:hypothetical protein